MPTILPVPGNLNNNTAEVELSKEGLIIDERVIEVADNEGPKFECSIEGTILRVKRVDKNEGWGYWGSVHFRIYDPDIETVPEFTSKSYRYHGLEGEQAPGDVEEVVVDPSVTVIKALAFSGCRKMKRCIMGDNVERIEGEAFADCKSMKSIRLSRGLLFIGESAFWGCKSIECLFIPPNVQDIQWGAFGGCSEMKLLVLPANIELQQLGGRIACHCHKLLSGTVQYAAGHNEQVNHWLKHHYDHLPLLRLCTDPDVTAPMIRNFIQDNGTAAFYQTDDGNELTPLHILTRYNASASIDQIISCYSANPGALFTPDSEAITPHDNLWANGEIDVILHIMQDLCIHRLNH